MIRQWFIYDESRFESKCSAAPAGPGELAVSRNGQRYLITGVRSSDESLIDDLFNLANNTIVCHYQEYNGGV